MTNEKLVVEIQNGHIEKLSELWENIERFIKKMANQYAQFDGGFAEFDDLYNAGYIAFIKAVETYTEACNMSFIGWLVYFLKSEFSIARYGNASEKSKMDPLNYAASLDAPLDNGDPEGGTLNDIIPDPQDDIENAEERIYTEDLRNSLNAAISTLTKEEQKILYLLYIKGFSLGHSAAKLNVPYHVARRIAGSALQRLKHPKFNLERFLDLSTDFYAKSGISSFVNSGGSSVEWITIDREKMRKEIEKTISHSQSI